MDAVLPGLMTRLFFIIFSNLIFLLMVLPFFSDTGVRMEVTIENKAQACRVCRYSDVPGIFDLRTCAPQRYDG